MSNKTNEELREHLRLANAALKVANANVEEAKRLSAWANQKLTEKEEEIRHMRIALLAAYEPPPNAEIEGICKKLEYPYGMVSPTTANQAAYLLRRLWRCVSNNGRSEG